MDETSISENKHFISVIELSTSEINTVHTRKNIPYGQSSAKLPVTQSLSQSATQSLGHLVTWSLSHLVTQSLGSLWSLSHLVIRSLFSLLLTNTHRHRQHQDLQVCFAEAILYCTVLYCTDLASW